MVYFALVSLIPLLLLLLSALGLLLRFSVLAAEAQQQVLTMGGSAVGRGAVDRVYGGGNRNAATARGAFAGQQVVTVGGQ